MEKHLDVEALLAPIPGTAPCGEDLAFSEEFDAIKEARRADADLPQDEWVRKLKFPEWPKVVELSAHAISGRTKDLQLVVWLVEALTQTRSFAGLREGITLLEQLIERYWDDIHPRMDDGPGMRAGKLAWLNLTLPAVIESLPVTSGLDGTFALRHWNEALAIDNLARKDPFAAQQAIEGDGKISNEAFDKAVKSTSNDFYLALADECKECQAAVDALEAVVGMKLGGEAPSFGEMKRALSDVSRLVFGILRDRGISNDAQDPEPSAVPSKLATSVGSLDPLQSRQHALAKLAEVSAYFRTHEPHSPVAHLVDRAARWAGMPLESWLQEVIKDGGTLTTLYELLGMRRPDAN